MDVTAEFYLETLRHVFMSTTCLGDLHLARQAGGPSVIRDTALLTVEGAHDDMCSSGQTEAAHRLCTGIPQTHKRHHLQEGVGHYGVFAGARWAADIYPVIRNFIASRQTR
jgi:poly(3-hydroxybutyrate) depolymerase